MPNELRSLPPETVHRTRLSNGLTVLVREDHSAPVTAVVTYVKAGYFDETDDVSGIAHVLEHMFFKGTPTRSVGEIAKQTKASGGYLNAATIYDHTSYYAVLPTSGFDAGLEVQADAYANSVIDVDELRRELEVIIEEAKRKEDNPGAVTTETLYEILHDRHRMRRWRIGREEPLRALRQSQLLRFYRNFYRPSNTILVVAGDVTPDRVMPRIESLYGHLTDASIERSPGDQETGRTGRRFRERAGDIAQTQVAFGWRTPGTLHSDTPLLDVAASVLAAGRSSRLYRSIRERQLASSVTAYNYTPTELGVFVTHIEGEPERAREATRAMWNELAVARAHGFRDDELERSRRLFESRWLRRLETMEGQANYLAEWEALGDWRFGDEYANRIVTATPNDVLSAMRKHLTGDDVGVMVYRPEKSAPFSVDAGHDLFTWLDSSPQDGIAPNDPPKPALAIVRDRTLLHEASHGKVEVFRTARGVPILVQHKPESPVVHLGVYASGGASLEEANEAGIATLLTRTSVKGTERRSAESIALESELLGGSISPAVTSDGIGWTFSVPTARVAAAVELLSDVVLSPAFPEPALETERRVALSQLAQMRDDMFRYPVRLAYEAAYGAHPYGRGVMGSDASLRAIGTDALRRWHTTQVLRSDSVIAVVGDIDAVEIAQLLAAAFARLEWCESSPLQIPEWPHDVQRRVETRDKAQSALSLMFPGPSRREPSRIAGHLIAGVASGLGGRFFDSLRDKQSLAYTVHLSASDRFAAGAFVSYIATSPEKEEIARAGLLREFERFRDEVVTTDELERAKTYAIGTHAIAQQSGGNLLSELVDAHLYGGGLQELDAFPERVRAVTPEAMREIAHTYFDTSRRAEGVVRGRGAG